jgi:hypothetical protein
MDAPEKTLRVLQNRRDELAGACVKIEQEILGLVMRDELGAHDMLAMLDTVGLTFQAPYDRVARAICEALRLGHDTAPAAIALRMHGDPGGEIVGAEHLRILALAAPAIASEAARKARIETCINTHEDIRRKIELSSLCEEFVIVVEDGVTDPAPIIAALHRLSTNSAAHSHVRLIPFEQIVLGEARRDLVKSIIPRVGLVVVWGPPKCGKSFWVFDLVMHVALGWEYRGRRVHQGPVVYCAFEGQTGMEARIAAFRHRHLKEHTEAVPFYLQPVRMDLVRDHAAFIATVRRQLDGAKPVVLVLDTLNRSLSGSESNDDDMSAYINAADAIREAFDCAVIIVHHCGINGDRPRGHTSLTGAVEAQLSVERDAADNIVVEVELAKDGPQGTQIVSCLEVVEVGRDTDGEAISSCVVVSSDAEAMPANAKVSGAAEIALRLLRKAIDEAGQPAPPTPHIPAGTRTTTPDMWRSYCYQGCISESTDPDARRKAFVRASRTLQARNIIAIWGENVWLK